MICMRLFAGIRLCRDEQDRGACFTVANAPSVACLLGCFALRNVP